MAKTKGQNVKHLITITKGLRIGDKYCGMELVEIKEGADGYFLVGWDLGNGSGIHYDTSHADDIWLVQRKAELKGASK